MKLILWSSFLCALLVSTPALASDYSSAYTKIDSEKHCTVFARAQEGDGEWANLVCDGYRGYPVMIFYSDLRESIFYGFTKGGTLAPRWESFAGFNQTSKTIEWRLKKMNDLTIPFATIHRWFIEESGAPQVEVLVVEKVGQVSQRDGCAVGYVVASNNPGANAQAREIADNTAENFDCVAGKPAIRAGNVPLPNIVRAEQ
ncbi:MAG: hypothetical protein ACR2OJ_17710 [Hyphomicrobiales bacterium]